MLFSIVIPVYNVEKYLSVCMDSILKQVNDINNDCEILLIDDGSTDNSGKLCDKYALDYPNLVKVFHKENQGLLATRRYGFKRTSGEYIINCDSDDTLESKTLKKLKNIIDKYNLPDVILFNFNYWTESTKRIAYNNVFGMNYDIAIEKKLVLKMFLKNHSVVSLCTKIFKKSCIDVDKDYSSLYKISNGEDSLQSIEIYNNSQTFIYINESLYNYRIESGMTRKFDKRYYSGFKVILEEIKQQKEKWRLDNFDTLFAIKVMQTVGRAITQSRYNHWDSYKQHKEYLKRIRNDEIVCESIEYLLPIKKYLQRDHFFLLLIIKYRFYWLLCILLYAKNIMT